MRDQKGVRNLPVQCGKDGSVGLGQLRQVPVSSLLSSFHPGRKVRNVKAIGDKYKPRHVRFFQAKQERPGLRDRESVGGSLGQYSDEPKFGNRTGRKKERLFRARDP